MAKHVIFIKSVKFMEKSRSWSSAHDWKSCNRQKRFEGSNPSFSAKGKSRRDLCVRGFFLLYLLTKMSFFVAAANMTTVLLTSAKAVVIRGI